MSLFGNFAKGLGIFSGIAAIASLFSKPKAQEAPPVAPPVAAPATSAPIAQAATAATTEQSITTPYTPFNSRKKSTLASANQFTLGTTSTLG